MFALLRQSSQILVTLRYYLSLLTLMPERVAGFDFGPSKFIFEKPL